MRDSDPSSHSKLSAAAILTLVLGANALAWAWANRPVEPPAWRGPIPGVSFSPYREGQDPIREIHPTRAQLEADLDLLRPHVRAVRTYTALDGFDVVPALARERGLDVVAGAWLDDDLVENELEVERIVEIANSNPNVTRLIVGNEALLRGDLKAADLARYLRRVRERVAVPVSTAEPWHVWTKHLELGREVDFVAIHVLPYWEGVPLERSVRFVFDRVAEVQKKFPGKPILVSEVGWPSNGRIRRGAVPSLANQAWFLREFMNAAEARGLDYFVMEAFDQPWKIPVEGGVGAYWGLFDWDRRQKFAFEGPIVGVPEWPWLAAASGALALLPVALFLLAFSSIAVAGRLFFASLAQVAASAWVWVSHQTLIQYHSLWSATAWVLLLGFLGLLLLIVLTEGFELVELVWKRRWSRRVSRAAAPDPEFPPPRVSIHVPISSEPPEMVKETLAALARLDYPNFEVLVIDNNTADPGLWKPVADQCEILGSRFRFFHVERCVGFKAGALNIALRHTDPAATVIAVIDSDYVVRADWLANLTPHFADPKVAIVQAPQDYRDRHESAFKALCHTEYAGFFQIGMVHRNERNAIIQHGTMTLVRRVALERVGGWAEWCICEDAELGLRLFQSGHQAVYVPHSYGRGLMPDTFAAYQRQRFRWAYGAVQILKRHWRALLPWSKGGLTGGQRYHFVAGWLPWFADALNGAVTLLAVVWSAGLVLAPRWFEFPLGFFLTAALGFFALKVGKTLWLYAVRVRCRLRANLGAALAGLSLTHTISKAVISGLLTRERPFMRTPKCENQPALVRALLASREEAILLGLLAASALAITLRYPRDLDATLWIALLAVQALPYAASLATALVNATAGLLPERLGLEAFAPPSYDPVVAPLSHQHHLN